MPLLDLRLVTAKSLSCFKCSILFIFFPIYNTLIRRVKMPLRVEVLLTVSIFGEIGIIYQEPLSSNS